MRRWFFAFVAFGALAAPTGLSGQTGGSVSGAVLGRFETQVRPLPFATVEAWGPGIHRTLVADSAGQYLLTALPPGALRVRVTHPGYEPVELDVVVPSNGATLLDVELRARPVELPPVDVTTDVRIPDADRRDVAAEAAAAGRVDAAALEIGMGAVDAGLAEAVRAFGGNDPAQATDVLFMRGSTTDLKLVLLDGAPVYTPFHVAGLLRSFEPSVLGRA
ncbi:MAG TPA: carboxypeptidase-like regulatory domain-containing protein, partial [Longimicrobiales bacterium]|nr:carboxypeptidase-like regulatory domain-containing protein [Longimicrobiales bacterium]